MPTTLTRCLPTSQWDGELWGKPTAVDAQSTREGTESAGGPPGAGWAYNDVRVNLGSGGRGAAHGGVRGGGTE
jgi:hypothetical protein